MSDRCTLYMEIRKEDQPKVVDVLGTPDYIEGEPVFGPETVSLEWAEMNYGAAEDRKTLAESGIPFIGSHDAGDEYGPYVFASDGVKMSECPSHHGGLSPVVEVSLQDGKVMPLRDSDVFEAEDYLRTFDRAACILKGETPWATDAPSK